MSEINDQPIYPNARLGTKKWYLDEFRKVQKESFELNKRLMELCKQEKVTSGCLLAYDPHRALWYEELSNLYTRSRRRKARLISIQSSYDLFVQDVNRLREFVEEQEALPFEESQKQVLIREGKLQNRDKEE